MHQFYPDADLYEEEEKDEEIKMSNENAKSWVKYNNKCSDLDQTVVWAEKKFKRSFEARE